MSHEGDQARPDRECEEEDREDDREDGCANQVPEQRIRAPELSHLLFGVLSFLYPFWHAGSLAVFPVPFTLLRELECRRAAE